MANKTVFITRLGVFLPNKVVENLQIENFIGHIHNHDSYIKSLISRRNGIKHRFYALNERGEVTHTNAELAYKAIKNMLGNDIPWSSIDLLSCATSVPDVIFPALGSQLHGLLGGHSIELFTHSGVCLSSVQALKTAYWSVLTGSNKNVVCSTSELLSPLLLSSKFKAEYDLCKHTGTNPYMAFEKEFLRYMLSDGASAALLQSRPNSQDKSYKIEWIDMISYADKLPTCMLCGGEQRPDLQVIGWKEFSPFEWGNKSIFSIKQNIKLLQKYAITYFAKSIKYFLEKHQEKHIDFVLPHISSMFFYGQLRQALKDSNIEIGQKGWYTNLPQTGNIGSASILTILNGFTKEKEFNKGDRILLLVPESGRFSYGAVLLTVY